MDKDKMDQNGSGDESEKYLWIAALIVGIILIFMLIAISGIAIWKHFKKENTADQNWAGPSPLADGNTQEDINMNECILGRQRSLSSLSTAPVVPNELQAPKKSHVSENMPQGHYKEASMQDEDAIKTNMPTMPYISSEATSFSLDTSVGQQHPQEYSLNDETSLPPPPDDVLHFPMPPQINALPVIGDERDFQLLPQKDITQSDEHCNQISLYQKNTITDSFHGTCDIDDQLLPPPPPDLL